jgi:putative transcriptional regulator
VKLPTALRAYELFHLNGVRVLGEITIGTMVDSTRVDSTAVDGAAVSAAPQLRQPAQERRCERLQEHGPAEEVSGAGRATARPAPRVKTVRRALGLTQEEFATRYGIPLGTLRDWEQGRTEPDQPARAYIRVIACNPEWVSRALAAEPPQ